MEEQGDLRSGGDGTEGSAGLPPRRPVARTPALCVRSPWRQRADYGGMQVSCGGQGMAWALPGRKKKKKKNLEIPPKVLPDCFCFCFCFFTKNGARYTTYMRMTAPSPMLYIIMKINLCKFDSKVVWCLNFPSHVFDIKIWVYIMGVIGEKSFSVC